MPLTTQQHACLWGQEFAYGFQQRHCFESSAQSQKAFVSSPILRCGVETWRHSATTAIGGRSLSRGLKWLLAQVGPTQSAEPLCPPRDLAPAKSSSQYILIHLEFSPLQENPPGIPLKLQMRGRGNFGPQLALPFLQLKDLGRNEVMSIFTSARAQQPDHNSKRVQCQSRK